MNSIAYKFQGGKQFRKQQPRKNALKEKKHLTRFLGEIVLFNIHNYHALFWAGVPLIMSFTRHS
jgi:hypothetical protein